MSQGQKELSGEGSVQELHQLRERLVRTDKYLAKLYRWNAQLGQKINRVQRERAKLVRNIEALEVRCGERSDPD